MRRLILIPLLIIIAVFAIGGGVAYAIYNNYMYYGTDDAQVNGNIVNVSAPTAGVLSSLSVKLGDAVTAGEAIGAITPATAGTGAPATINVTSPINGSVVEIAAVSGQGVAAGLPIIEVTDLSQINVVAYVDEGAINNISTGQSVDITVDS